MSEPATSNAITTQVVPDNQRMGFMPWLFTPRHMMIGENRIFNIMERLTPDYKGALWTFVKTSNGAGFAYPKTDLATYHLTWADNGFEGDASPEISGLIATMMSIGSFWGAGSDDHFAERYHALDD